MMFHLPEGDVIKMPETKVELAGYEARWIVNRGLRDIVAQLGLTRLPRHPRNLALKVMMDTQPLLGDFELPYESVFREDMSGRS